MTYVNPASMAQIFHFKLAAFVSEVLAPSFLCAFALNGLKKCDFLQDDRPKNVLISEDRWRSGHLSVENRVLMMY